jgi:hypothetical protein
LKTLKNYLISNEQKDTALTEEVFTTEPMVLKAVDVVDELFLEEDEEKQNHHHPMDPPAVLIMRRKSVRTFPNNKRVALYYVDKIDKYVTVPYTSMQWTSVGEETNIFGQLTQIVENNKTDYILLEDGKKVSVAVTVAESVLSMYKVLNAKNKEMVLEMVKNKEQFNKLVDFAKSYSN